MCNHHFVLARVRENPEKNSYDDWKTLERLHMHDGLGIGQPEIDRGRAQALNLAELYAIADPDGAGELEIQRFSCNGPEDGPERPYAEGAPQATERERQLARRVIALRAALQPYARITARSDDDGVLRLELPADGGTAAAKALKIDQGAELDV